jgi:hypothetical protein
MNGECFLRVLARTFMVVLLTGCAAAKEDSFTLPKGDADRGQAAFIHFRCFDCHRVAGVDLPPGEEPDHVIVELGGKTDSPRPYSELVTAIINPSHRLAKGYTPTLVTQDGKSRMTVYNDVMTVSQLLDLVTFLQSHYELQPHKPTEYREYHTP